MKLKELVKAPITEQWLRDEGAEVIVQMTPPYYLGRAIKVTFSDVASTAYYDTIDDSITLSFPLLKEEFSNALMLVSKKPDSDLAEWEVEEFIRCNLFHETLHAMLTPRDLADMLPYFRVDGARIHDLVNIVEDERIERRGKGTFLKTDFEALNRVLFSPTRPTDSLLSKFFGWIRRHETTYVNETLRDMLRALFITYKDMVRDHGDSYSYVENIVTLWNLFITYNASEDNSENNNSENGEDGENENPPQNIDEPMNSISEKPEDGEDKEEPSENQIVDGPPSKSTGSSNPDTPKTEKAGTDNGEDKEDKGDDEEEEKEEENKDLDVELPEEYSLNIENGGLIKQLGIKTYDNSFLKTEFNRIFSAHAKSNALRTSARSAYGGKFNVKALERPYENEGKLWTRSGEGNHIGPDGFHLNTFIDSSGSMWRNNDKVNEIIKALTEVEKKVRSFTWTWIDCSVGQTVYWTKKDRPERYRAAGGNLLDYNIFEQFNQVQSKNKVNLNIVLFDGDANPPTPENWRAFNTRSTVVITDPENKRDITVAWGLNTGKKPQGKCIITHDYVGEFQKVLIEELERLVRTV